MKSRLLALTLLGVPILAQFSFGQVSVGVDAKTGQPVTYIDPMGPFGGRDANQDRMGAAIDAAEYGRRSLESDKWAEQKDIENQFRAREEVRRWQELELQNQRNSIYAASIRSEISQRQLENYKALKSQVALEAAAKVSAHIDMFHPDAEKQIKDAMANAYTHGADPRTLNDIFGDQLQQVTALKQRQSEIYVTRLGEDGRSLFVALQKDAGIDPDNALRMTKKSLDAEAKFDWYVDYAQKNGMPLAVTDEDLSKMRKKVGNLPPAAVSLGNGINYCDVRKDMWDMDEVLRWANTKVITPELTKKFNDERQFETEKRNAELAKIRAETSKIEAETSVIIDKLKQK